MTICFRLVAFVLLMLLVMPAVAQEKNLPRVLIIGDSIYSQHARGVSADLKGRAAVTMAAWPSDEIPSSGNMLKRLDQLLGYNDRNGKPLPKDTRPKWDLIHINVGLGDLIHRAPKMESFRVMPIHVGGVVTTDDKQYEANLNQLITQLKATGAEVVWASTTPIRHSTSNVFKMGTEIEYNAIAAKVMAKQSVPTNDMYRFVKHLINMDKPAGHGFDPFNFDKKPIHMPVVRTVEKMFGLKPMPETNEELAVKEAMKKPAPEQG
ncbi:MAG: SGNH/GDSL hydrolase family protein [Phycisphaeraceae bacterium]